VRGRHTISKRDWSSDLCSSDLIPVYGLTTLFVSLALIVTGTGLLKPTVSAVVGDLYSKEDYLRDSGFNIFYTGINLGALSAPLIVGTLGQQYNFHIGFSVAWVGMLIGLVTYVLTKRKFMGSFGDTAPNPLTPKEKKRSYRILGISITAILIIGGIVITTGTLTIGG